MKDRYYIALMILFGAPIVGIMMYLDSHPIYKEDIKLIPTEVSSVEDTETMLGASISGDLNTNLIAVYPFDEYSNGSAPVTREDAHTNSLDLTDNNTVVSDTGYIGTYSASFNTANNESLSRAVAKASALDITGDMTIAFWMKHHEASPSGSNDDILNRYGSSGDTAYRILMGDNGIYFFHHDGTTQRTPLFASADPVQNKWTCVIFVLDVSASTVRLYFGDEDDATIADLGTGVIGSATRSSDKPLVIGKWPDGTANNLNGDMQMLTIWNKALSSTEAGVFFNAGDGLSYADVTVTTSYTTGISGIDFY